MTTMQRRKGSRAEREARDILAGQLGTAAVVRVKEQGQDQGDIHILGIAAVQVKDWTDFGAAVIAAVDGAKPQAHRAGLPYSAGMVRRRGGQWVVVLDPLVFCDLLREAAAGYEPDRPLSDRTYEDPQ